VLQWIHHAAATLHSIAGLQTDGGYFAFSYFLQGTFHEIECVRNTFDSKNPVTYFSEDEINLLLHEAGYRIITREQFQKRYFFSSGLEVLKSINIIGAKAQKGLRLSRPELVAFCKEYEDKFKTHGQVPLTYSVFLGLAQKNGIV
jgi:hypothetical protein